MCSSDDTCVSTVEDQHVCGWVMLLKFANLKIYNIYRCMEVQAAL